MTTATRTRKPVAPEAAFRRVQAHAEKIKNDEPHTVETCSPGDAWAQGDILLLCLIAVPPGATVDPKPVAQLAPGTTQGSRHCIRDLSTVKLWRIASPTPLDGPVIEAPSGVTVEHPEHGDVTLPPGVYAVVYQRALAEELRRTVD
ncbi:MAG TPA: hypothetical protein VNH18_20755 [Bryobacteraceae bacterium]|nr:hypothetical protein [Bryobacteraceae bacterium]